MPVEQGQPLSERELEIIALVAEGLTNREIAVRLFLSPNTVKVHLRNIFTKTGVSSRTELSMLAVQEGWVELANQVEDTHENAQLIDDDAMPKDEALLGATVKVKDTDTEEEFDYMLVSEEESDLDQNKISASSPVGKALLGHKVGDVVEIQVPAGAIQYEIISITR